MTLRDVLWHREAIAEARAARTWYESQDPGAAAAFIRALDAAMALIGEAPGRWPEVVPGFRRVLLRRFPFGIVYRVRTGGIEVVAVAHARRRPQYWADRIMENALR